MRVLVRVAETDEEKARVTRREAAERDALGEGVRAVVSLAGIGAGSLALVEKGGRRRVGTKRLRSLDELAPRRQDEARIARRRRPGDVGPGCNERNVVGGARLADLIDDGSHRGRHAAISVAAEIRLPSEDLDVSGHRDELRAGREDLLSVAGRADRQPVRASRPAGSIPAVGLLAIDQGVEIRHQIARVCPRKRVDVALARQRAIRPVENLLPADSVEHDEDDRALRPFVGGALGGQRGHRQRVRFA